MELAGIIISGVGLVALESTVEDVFSKVSTWRHHGKDYEHLSLQLELAHLAYQRWSQTVKLVDSDTPTGPLNLPTASESEAKTVKKLLGAIASAFQDIEQTSQRYETGVGANDTPMETDEKKSPLDALMAKVRAANKARQAGTGVVQKAIWVVHDKSAFETLVGRVSKNVESLVSLFPGAPRHIQEQLAVLEINEIVPPNEEDYTNERQQLVQLLDASKKVDPILQASAAESIEQADKRHSYKNIQVKDRAKVIDGDELALGATAPGGPGHSYEDIVVSDDAQVLNGDRVGMPSFFN